MDGSKTSGVFPVSLMWRSGLSLCSSLGGLLVRLLAGGEKGGGMSPTSTVPTLGQLARRWLATSYKDDASVS